MNAPPDFPRHDPADAAFWDVRFAADFTPWDQGGVPALLAEHVRLHPAPTRTLIPGCGSAHDVRFLHQHGWPVTAIDFSAAAVARARTMLGPLGELVQEADFFGPTLAPGMFDVIYERAFMCALPRRMREAWAARVAELLPAGGLLIGFFFFDANEKGPPFGIGRDELTRLLHASFDLVEQKTPTDSIAVFQGKEQWMVWRRRPS